MLDLFAEMCANHVPSLPDLSVTGHCPLSLNFEHLIRAGTSSEFECRSTNVASVAVLMVCAIAAPEGPCPWQGHLQALILISVAGVVHTTAGSAETAMMTPMTFQHLQFKFNTDNEGDGADEGSQGLDAYRCNRGDEGMEGDEGEEGDEGDEGDKSNAGDEVNEGNEGIEGSDHACVPRQHHHHLPGSFQVPGDSRGAPPLP